MPLVADLPLYSGTDHRGVALVPRGNLSERARQGGRTSTTRLRSQRTLL